MHGLLNELIESGFAGCAIKCIGRFVELLAIQKAMYIRSDCVRRHHKDIVERVDILAGDRVRCMTQESRDRTLCKSEVVSDAGEVMPQNVRCEV